MPTPSFNTNMALTDIYIQGSNEEINRLKYIAGANSFRRSSLREIKSETYIYATAQAVRNGS